MFTMVTWNTHDNYVKSEVKLYAKLMGQVKDFVTD